MLDIIAEELITLKMILDFRRLRHVHAQTFYPSPNSDRVSQELASRRRLNAVKGFLVAGGFAGAIELEPKGMREPYEVDDPTRYNQAQIDQMNRRVELRSGQ